MNDEFKSLIQFELLLGLLCIVASALLAILWSFREVRGYADTERSLKTILALFLGLTIAVVAGALSINFPGWLFLINLAGLPFIAWLVVVKGGGSPVLAAIGALFKGWTASAPARKHHGVHSHATSGYVQVSDIQVPIKPIAHISKGYRRRAGRA